MSLRILVAGGCHVVGYPIGKEHSFANAMADQLRLSGVDTDIETIGFLPVTHAHRMVEAIRSTQPDVTILQLGNYETTVTFRQYARRRLGLKKEKASSTRYDLPSDVTFRRSRLWKVKCGIKLAVDTLLGHDLVNFEEMEPKFAAFFEAIRQETTGEVIVLGPLPSADPLYVRYRHRLSVVMQRLALTCGFRYISAPLGEENCDPYYVDATHLNATGHARLGGMLATVVGSVRRSLPQDSVDQHLVAR
jgi:hypothetical protein